MPFEIAINPNNLQVTGHAHLLEGDSTADFGRAPVGTPGALVATNYTVQRDQDIVVRFHWQTSGIFTAFLGGGKWTGDVLLEQMGGGETRINPVATINDTGAPNSYQLDVQINKNTLPEGVYRFVARLRWSFASGRPGPIVAFHDMGFVNVYED